MRAAHLGIVATLSWLTGCEGGKKITFEILPEDDDGGPSSAAVYGDFQDAIRDRGSLEDFGQLSGLATGVDDLTVIPDKDHAAVDIVADAKIRATAQTDIDISAGGGLIGRFVEPMDMVAGAASLRTAGNLTAAAGGGSLQVAGNLQAYATGGAELSALSAKAQLADALDLAAGSNVSMSSGGDTSVQGRGSATAAFGGELRVSGTGMHLEGTEALTAATSSVDVRGRDGVHVAATGADFQLGGDGEVEFVAFVWRSSPSFDEFENAVPVIEGARQLIINRRPGADDPVAAASHGTRLRLDIASAALTNSDASPEWMEGVWSASVGEGLYSLNGLRVHLDGPMDVVAVRLTSNPFNNPSYQGWSQVIFHFGRLSSPGSVALRAAGRIEATAAESVSMHSRQIFVDAENVSVSGDTVELMSSGGLTVQSAGALDTQAEEMHLHAHEDMSVYSGGAASIMGHTIQVDAGADATVRAGGTLQVIAEQADLQLGDKLTLTGADADVKLEGGLDIYAAHEVAMRTQSMTLQAGGELSAFAGGKAELVAAQGLHVATGGDITVQGVGQQLELSHSEAGLVTDGHVGLDSRSLTARAGAVKIEGHAAAVTSVRFSLDISCGEDGDNETCTDATGGVPYQDALLDEMAELLGVPRSRLVARRIVTDSSGGDEGDAGRRRMQEGQQGPEPTPTQQQQQQQQRLSSSRRRAESTSPPTARSQAPPPMAPSPAGADGQAAAYAAVKRRILKALTQFFRSGEGGDRGSAAQQKLVAKAVLSSEAGGEVHKAWKLFAGQEGEQGDDLGGFVDYIVMTM